MIRALAVDIDGTLTDEHRILSPLALEALLGISAPVILTTGNTHCFTRAVSVLLGTPRIFIAENGGVLSYSEDEMEILADIGVCEEAYQLLSRAFPLKRYNASRYRFTDIALLRNFDVKAASEYLRQHSLPVEIIDTAFAVHIKDRRVNKGTGLQMIADRMGLDPGEFAAIGDSMSDAPMFRLAGFRACVGNAVPEIKAISDYVAEARYGEGFAEIMRFMVERGMIQGSQP
ncbi:MAG: phosphoglycolate phosphatase [Methanothrix sp.]|nr:phosphoglycolate phosphatase [Methanothrix sp.]